MFNHKGGFLDRVDWRAREFNGAADLVADQVMDSQRSIDTLPRDKLHECLNSGSAIQIYADGGFSQGCGSAALVLISVTGGGVEMQRNIIGFKGVFFESVFRPSREVAALEMAMALSITMRDCIRERS